MKALLDLLSDGAFHSGEELGGVLGVSRSAVWKRLRKVAEELGLQVHAVRGRGYRLASPLSLLGDAASLSAALGWPVRILPDVDSTNLEALRYLTMGQPSVREPLLILAEQQTAGRGRRGRPWVSPFGENLYLSLVLPVDGGARQLDGLSLSVGVAVQRALAGYGIQGLGLKWPNDVLVGGRKLAGILLELHGDPADKCAVVIGIGINVNMQSADVDQPWTSLRECTGDLASRRELALGVGLALKDCLALHVRGGFPLLRDEWQAAHLWQGRKAVLSSGAVRIEGRVCGVDAGGALLLESAGIVSAHNGGELSLRLADDS